MEKNWKYRDQENRSERGREGPGAWRRTGDADVVSEDEPAGGGDDAGEEHEHGELAGVVLAPSGAHHHAAGHRDPTNSSRKTQKTLPRKKLLLAEKPTLKRTKSQRRTDGDRSVHERLENA